MSGEPRPVSTPRHHLDPKPDPSGWKKSSECCIILIVENENSNSGFAGLRVLSLESRRAPEMAKLIASNGGECTVAPSMREIRRLQPGAIGGSFGSRRARHPRARVRMGLTGGCCAVARRGHSNDAR